MSLKDEYFQRDKFVIMDKTTVDDDYGSVKTIWREGASIEATVEETRTTGAEIARGLTEKKTFTVFTKSSVILKRGDAIKRLSDGQAFIMTSDAENRTPQSSSLNMRRCEAEETILKDSE
jgi:hypothetical protein